MKFAYLDSKSLTKKLAKELAEDGMRAVIEAYETAEFTTRTGNLADSYGSAVYLDGELIYDSIFFFEPTATTPRQWYGEAISGHQEMIEYFRNFKPRSKGLSLILIAAMPYTDVLEKGYGAGPKRTFSLKRKYKVISGANTIMRNIANKYKSGKFGRRRGLRTNISVNPIK